MEKEIKKKRNKQKDERKKEEKELLGAQPRNYKFKTSLDEWTVRNWKWAAVRRRHIRSYSWEFIVALDIERKTVSFYNFRLLSWNLDRII